MKVENIYKSFVKNKQTINVLNGITCHFAKGKLYAIMGKSGSGKSTLIKILGLIDKPDEGTYEINQKNMLECSNEEICQYRNQKIGFVFQDFYLDEYLKAYENVMLPLLINKNIAQKNRKDIAINMLNKMDLSSRINHFPKELSGGEKQRVAIARALVNDPDIILADEPTGNLDEENEEIIFALLKSLCALDKTIIVVSHSEKIKEYADEVFELKNGKLEKYEK